LIRLNNKLLHHTSGAHTMESSLKHVALLIEQEGKPEAIFTGDTLSLIGDVGRPLMVRHQKVARIKPEYVGTHEDIRCRSFIDSPSSIKIYDAFFGQR